MTTEETQLQDSTGLPLTISDEDAAAELRGDIIADEVDAAPVKKTKATVPAKAAEPPPDDDVDEVDEDLVKKVLAGQGEDDGDEEEDEAGEQLMAGPLKQLLADQKASYEERLAAATEKIAALEGKAAKADLTLENIVEQALAGKVSKEDLLEMAADLFYLAEPDRADPDTKIGLERKKLTIQQRRNQALLEEKEAEVRERLEAADANARYMNMEMEARERTISIAEDIPHLMAHFGGDVKRIAHQALLLAQRYAVNIDPDSPNIPDLSSEAMLKQLEQQAAEIQSNLQSKKAKPTKKAKLKALPVSETLTQYEQDLRDAEELRAAMNE